MFEYGDMLWLKNESMGETLYMVINPPIECEHCGKKIYDWELSENGEYFCPECREKIVEFKPVKCHRCGENDLVSVIVAANNNFGCSFDGEVTPYNHMVNKISSFCKKEFIKDIEKGKIRYLSKEETIYRKRLLVWTGSNQYEPGKKMPEWVYELIPD